MYHALPCPSVANARVTGVWAVATPVAPTARATSRAIVLVTRIVPVIRPRSRRERGRDLVQEALELRGLVPGRHPERQVREPRVEVRAELLDAALRAAGDRPPF